MAQRREVFERDFAETRNFHPANFLAVGNIRSRLVKGEGEFARGTFAARSDDGWPAVADVPVGGSLALDVGDGDIAGELELAALVADGELRLETDDGVARECGVSASAKGAVRIEESLVLVGGDYVELERQLGGIGGVKLHGAGG